MAQYEKLIRIIRTNPGECVLKCFHILTSHVSTFAGYHPGVHFVKYLQVILHGLFLWVVGNRTEVIPSAITVI